MSHSIPGVVSPFISQDILFFDNQSTTPCDPRVVEAMLPYFSQAFGNPHSRSHAYGWEAESAVEKARAQIAQSIGSQPEDIVFTSGATESNNLAIKGCARFYRAQKNHLITCQTEHKCVLESFQSLEREGFTVTYLPIKSDGLLDLDLLAESIQPQTGLVSIMAVNNEIGVIQDLQAIGKICREKGVFFHTDAAQALGKIPLDVEAMSIDLMSLSGHKIYGPKGVGVLYVRRNPRVRLTPLFSGGGQERGMRSGTLPTPLCVGMGLAAEIAVAERSAEQSKLRAWQIHLKNHLMTHIPDLTLNGSFDKRIAGNLNFSFSCVEGESLLMALRNMAVSSGSACTSASLEPSYVLRALGVEAGLAHSSLRFSFGRFNTFEEIETLGHTLVQAVERLRAMSPLWDMKQQGIDLNQIAWDKH